MATLYDLDQHYHLDHLIHRDYPARLDNPDHSYLPDQFNHVTLTTCLELDWNNLQKRIIDWIFVKFEEKKSFTIIICKKNCLEQQFAKIFCGTTIWQKGFSGIMIYKSYLEQHLQNMVNCNNLQQYYPEQQFARKNNWQNLRKISRTPICKKVFQGNNLWVENL